MCTSVAGIIIPGVDYDLNIIGVLYFGPLWYRYIINPNMLGLEGQSSPFVSPSLPVQHYDVRYGSINCMSRGFVTTELASL